MVKLKKYELGDLIKTKDEYKWKSPFVVDLIHKGYIVAINKKSVNWVFLFIKSYSGEVFYGSSRFLKYGLKTKQEIRDFIDSIIMGEIKFEYDNCTSVELILDETEFERNERREQVTYE